MPEELKCLKCLLFKDIISRAIPIVEELINEHKETKKLLNGFSYNKENCKCKFCKDGQLILDLWGKNGRRTKTMP